jgi:hypothetical protein
MIPYQLCSSLKKSPAMQHLFCSFAAYPALAFSAALNIERGIKYLKLGGVLRAGEALPSHVSLVLYVVVSIA